MNSLSAAAPADGKRLPVPTRQPREAEKKSKVPYAGKEPAVPLEVLPPGTIIDGVDCSGMTKDPKKGDAPVWLQTQNRRGLTPEQKAKVDAVIKTLKDAEKKKVAERKATAKNLGIAPTEMKKAGAPLKSEIKAKAEKTKKAAAKPTTKKASPKAATKAAKPRSKVSERAKYDWNGARERAAKGTVPPAPDFSANTHRSYRPALAEVEALVKAKDLAGLQAYKVHGSSGSPNAIKKYREIAIMALKAKKTA